MAMKYLIQGSTSDPWEREIQSLMCTRITYANKKREQEAHMPLHPQTLTNTDTCTHKLSAAALKVLTSILPELLLQTSQP